MVRGSVQRGLSASGRSLLGSAAGCISGRTADQTDAVSRRQVAKNRTTDKVRSVMAKIFVSHAHEDKDLVYQITAALSEAGLEPWLDVQELRPGEELLGTIGNPPMVVPTETRRARPVRPRRHPRQADVGAGPIAATVRIRSASSFRGSSYPVRTPAGRVPMRGSCSSLEV